MTSAMPSWARADHGPAENPAARVTGVPDQSGLAMSKSAKPAAKVDTLMTLAGRALAETHYFECIHAALEALELCHAQRDYERMARILLPLQEARRQVRLQAIDAGRLTIMGEMPGEGETIEAGCYLIEPPLVGADAREIRDRAAREEIPVMVLAREPAVKAVKLDRRPGDWPVVMIGPVTVRTYVRPPENGEVSLEWFIEAGEALGDRAIADVDSGVDAFARVDELFERLHTVTDHEKLHQALEAACREAVIEAAKPQPRRSKGLPRPEDMLEADEAGLEAEEE